MITLLSVSEFIVILLAFASFTPVLLRFIKSAPSKYLNHLDTDLYVPQCLPEGVKGFVLNHLLDIAIVGFLLYVDFTLASVVWAMFTLTVICTDAIGYVRLAIAKRT